MRLPPSRASAAACQGRSVIYNDGCMPSEEIAAVQRPDENTPVVTPTLPWADLCTVAIVY